MAFVGRPRAVIKAQIYAEEPPALLSETADSAGTALTPSVIQLLDDSDEPSVIELSDDSDDSDSES